MLGRHRNTKNSLLWWRWAPGTHRYGGKGQGHQVLTAVVGRGTRDSPLWWGGAGAPGTHCYGEEGQDQDSLLKGAQVQDAQA